MIFKKPSSFFHISALPHIAIHAIFLDAFEFWNTLVMSAIYVQKVCKSFQNIGEFWNDKFTQPTQFRRLPAQTDIYTSPPNNQRQILSGL